ncbi:DUF4277 domain-containing protein [Siminovitchia terrae]|uniref:DUF4277 domain-containing protein n=1 Tax=Siminovitchia terrae TaxID=1914933 RepID=UPI0024588F5F|nr:DUF4277 domain-containing protein [Siminovitchia terrae]
MKSTSKESSKNSWFWDKGRCHLSLGARLKTLLINILCDRQLLNHVQRFFEEQDVERLFGKGVKAEDLNEYSICRALDALHLAISWKVYSILSVIIRMLNKAENSFFIHKKDYLVRGYLPISQIHNGISE